MCFGQGGAVRLIAVLLILSNAANGLAASYVYGNGELLVKVNDTGIYYYHSDNLGSVSAITNEEGEIVGEQVNLPFGGPLAWSEKYSFTGKEFDPDLNFYYFGARYYSPLTGGFLSVDPARDGLNWYAYAKDNPLRFIDPLGKQSLEISEKYMFMTSEKFAYLHKEQVGKVKIEKEKNQIKKESEGAFSKFINSIKNFFTPKRPDYLEDLRPTTTEKIAKAIGAAKELRGDYMYHLSRGGCGPTSLMLCEQLAKLGMDSKVILGHLGKEEHAWVVARAGDEGEPLIDYYIDITASQFVGPSGVVIIPKKEAFGEGYEKLVKYAIRYIQHPISRIYPKALSNMELMRNLIDTGDMYLQFPPHQ